MLSNKLMLNLILYVFVFTGIIFLIGNIMESYYKNVFSISKNISQVSEITKFDLYMLKTIKIKEIQIKKIGIVEKDESSYFITFQQNDGTTYSFIKKGNALYYNQIKLCENVDFFRVVLDRSEKESITVDITILGKLYNFQYIID